MPLSLIDQLQGAKDRSDLARLLRYEPAKLSYIVNKIPPDQRYVHFEIKKKGGGSRRISAPVPRLRALQRQLVLLFEGIENERHAAGASRRGSLSHGFRKGHSIVTNAMPHRSQRYVLNLDLKDFFPSINFGRVRGFFLKNNGFRLSETVATAIAQIACHDNALPQGAPTSPIISNLIAHILDVRLARLAGANGCTYTRYADDLTISTHAKSFPADIAYQVGDNNEWTLAAELKGEIERSGFAINTMKTRMQCRANRQLVTGLTVNAKVNVRTEYYRQARAVCKNLFGGETGFYTDASSGDQRALTPAQIEGRFNHIHQVRDHSDLRDEKAKLENPSASHALYRRLTFYNAFAAPSLPLVLCEGKTDNVYLKCALNSLYLKFPKLIEVVNGELVRKIKFFNYNRKRTFEFNLKPRGVRNELAHLNGGASHLAAFIAAYDNGMGFYEHTPRQHPIIVLIDNDVGSKGTNGIFSVLKNKYKVSAGPLTHAQFYHITSNLFLVKTPERGSDGDSCIEDLFDTATLKIPFEGKTFKRTNGESGPGEYGKTVFAERVIKPNASSINFSGFEPLLQRIQDVIEAYQAPPP